MSADDLMYLGIYIGCGLITGLLTQKLIWPLVSKFVKSTKWKIDDLFYQHASKWILAWFVMLGILLGLRRIEMEPKYFLWLHNGVAIFYVLSITAIIANVLAGSTQIRNSDGQSEVTSSSIIGNIIKVVVYSVGILVILQSLGIAITPILTALGVGGIAVALALQDTLSNLFAGIQIIATRKINIGNLIRLDSGQEGTVYDVSWRYTSLRTGDNNIIVIPNNKLSTSIVSNFTLENREFVCNIQVGVDYNSDLEYVEKVALSVAEEIKLKLDCCVAQFKPFVRFQQFGDSSIDLKLFLKVKTMGDQGIVKHELIKALKKRFETEGINIPYPVRTIINTKTGN